MTINTNSTQRPRTFICLECGHQFTTGSEYFKHSQALSVYHKFFTYCPVCGTYSFEKVADI